jgi:hypothetical protein
MLPVSIVVPHLGRRGVFFRRFVLPSIEANKPAEILIEDGPGSAPEKRNAGARRAKQPFLLFVDDDTVLGRDCLEKMVGALEPEDAGFVYCDYTGIVLPGVSHPESPVHTMGSKPYQDSLLRRSNFIDTTSLLRRAVFPGFDESLKRFQDWDLWLTLLERNVRGIYLKEVLFFKFSIDLGITASVPIGPAIEAIRKKHRL